MLIAAGHAHPVMPSEMAHQASVTVGQFNDAIVDAVTRGEEPGYLVSPLLGSAIPANAWEILTVGALLSGGSPDDPAGLTERMLPAMRRGGRSLVRDGAPIEDTEVKTILLEVIAGIVEHRVPLFRALGVLAG